MKNKIIIGIVVCAAILLVSGASIMAFASPGTSTDPLITLSYLTDIFRPQVSTEIEKTGQELTERFNARISTLESQLNNSQSGPSTGDPGPADVFTVVTLRRGQSLTCSVGVEIMLRIGSASAFGTSPALVNTTAGTTLSSGNALVTNNMYLVTIEGNGITATADSTRVLIRGAYTIS